MQLNIAADQLALGNLGPLPFASHDQFIASSTTARKSARGLSVHAGVVAEQDVAVLLLPTLKTTKLNTTKSKTTATCLEFSAALLTHGALGTETLVTSSAVNQELTSCLYRAVCFVSLQSRLSSPKLYCRISLPEFQYLLLHMVLLTACMEYCTVSCVLWN